MKSLYNDKRGFAFTVTSALFIIIVLGTVVGLASFLFSVSLRYILIGVAIIGASVWLLGKVLEGNKVTGKKIMPVLLILALGIGVIAFGQYQQTSYVINDGIYVAEEGRIECRERDDHKQITKKADENYEFTCGEGYLVDECRVYATCQDTPWYNSQCGGGGYWNILPTINIDGIAKGTTHKLIATLQPGESIQFTDKINNAEKLEIDYEFNPYQLFVIERGRKEFLNSQSCSLANQNELSTNQFESGDWKSLTKGSWENYFLNYEKIYGAQIYDYNRQDVICNGNSIYELNEVNLESGKTINLREDRIKTVECCPHQTQNCDPDTFKFIEEEVVKECDYDYQCRNTGDPYIVGNTVYKQKCENHECVESVKSVECVSDAQCREIYGDGYGCDLKYNNFGECVEISDIISPSCGDGICQRAEGENYMNCPEDCDELSVDLNCEWYEQSIPAGTQEDCGFANWKKSVPLVSCDEIKYDATCKTADWVFWAGAGLVILVLGITTIIVYRPTNNKPKKKILK